MTMAGNVADDSMTVEVRFEQPAREAIEMTEVLAALSDPIRLQIAREIASSTEVVCGTLQVPVSPATRSHHLKVLREAGVTHTRADGKTRVVSLRRDDLDARFPGLLDAVLRTP
jgi:DNA-binding transcriptional ArsR family regulator